MRRVFTLVVVAVVSFAAGLYVGSELYKPAPAPLAPVKVYVVNDRDYYGELLDWIERANKSIHIAMYVFKSDTDTIERVVEALVSKARQGLDVKVLLESEVDPNELTYHRLMRNGVQVRFDSRAKRTHCKLVIVDGYVVIVGSHNLTKSAMTSNHEASVVIVSREVGAVEEEYFNRIWHGG